MHGCSRCNKLFPGGVGERNYSGFDVSNWQRRTTEEHRTQMIEISSCNTITEQTKLESKYGTRFSVLAMLPYYDTINMSIVDPMHNLFLGTAKHLLKIWREYGYLNKSSLELIQSKVDSFIVPHDMGKLPRKIISCFDGFNADEYKNWTLLYSIYCLNGIIPQDDMNCWRKFVLACNYLCRKSLSINDVTIAHNFLLSFCQQFENLYGKDRVTPNMHLHMHLMDCVQDFGPIYGFWLFSFERYNGLLGIIHTNKKNIELQIMQRFCSENVVLNIEKPRLFRNEFADLLDKLNKDNSQRGTLHETTSGHRLLAKICARTTSLLQPWNEFSHLVKPLSKISVDDISDYQKQRLKNVYSIMYPNINIQAAEIQESVEKCFVISVDGQVFGSIPSRNKKSAYVMAYWAKAGGEIGKSAELGLQPRPGLINYFLRHSFMINQKHYVHWFAFCRWFLPIDQNVWNTYGKPVHVWYRKLFECEGPASYIPVARIHSKFVHAPISRQSKELMVAIPRIVHSIH